MPRLTAENTQRAREVIALYPKARSALIPILHIAQEQDGYLTEEAMSHAAELVGLTSAEVRGTASFYDMLFMEPVGRYLLSVCTNIACLLNGGYELLEHAESSLGVRAGGRTPDGNFTLEEVECIALCGNAPCLAVNWRFFGDVTPAKFDQLVEDLRGGRLDETVPAHGTLCRVRRSVGLQADGPSRPSSGPAPAPTAPAPPTTTPHGSEVPAGPAPSAAQASPAQPDAPTPGSPQPDAPTSGTPPPSTPGSSAPGSSGPVPGAPESSAPEASAPGPQASGEPT